MRISRLTSHLLIIAILAVLAAACAPVAPAPPPPPTIQISPLPAPLATPAGPVTLTYWEEDSDAAGVLLDELAAAFTAAHPNITIERVHFSYDDLRNQFRAESLFEGEPPDLVRSPGEFTGPFGELRIVQPADAIFPPDLLDGFLPGALAGATLHGKVWGLPDNFGGHLMLFYNRALVDSVPAETNAWAVQLERLTDANAGQYGLVFDTSESYWLIPWLAGFGGWPLDANEKPALDTVEMEQALAFLADLKNVRRVMPEQADYQAAFDLFAQGKAAYIVDGLWNLDQYTGLGVDVGMALLPRVSETQLLPAPMATGRYWFIAKGAQGDKLAAAAQFVAYMTSAPVQQKWLTRMRRLPSSKQVLTSPAITSDPILAAAAEQLRLARGVPPVLEMACAWRGLDAYFDDVLQNEIAPSEAPARMQAEAEACVAEMTPDPTPTPTP